MNNGEPTDRYATERRLAGQLEAEWRDDLLGHFLEAEIPAAKRLGVSTYLAGPPYYQTAVEWIASATEGGAGLRTAVDIGGGLGRFVVELLRRCPEIASATYVEPSPTLYRWTEDLLTGSTVTRIPFVKGLGEVGWHDGKASVSVDAELLHKIRMVHGSADAPALKGAQFDLVTSLNVLDQCAYPSVLAEHVKKLVAPNGFLALSCTHQLQSQLYIDPRAIFGNLHDLIAGKSWELVAETELPFVSRMGDRHRNWFLSHHVLYRRVA